jgi:uncharacterized protein YndB with AHSA1/START domain
MVEWMRPGQANDCKVTLEPCVGGHFCIVMTSPDPSIEIVNRGEILILDRPSRLQFTWVSSRWGEQETLVTVELHELDAHRSVSTTLRQVA